MTETTIITTGTNSPDAASGSMTETEAPIEATENIASEVSDAAVEIAQIEAERDVRIAEISAETTQALAESAAEEDEIDDLDERLDQCQQSIETLHQRQDKTEELLQSILERLTPPEPSPQNQPILDESGEVTPDSPEVQEVAPPEPVRKRPLLRWI